MNKVLLTGVAVTLLFTLLPVFLPMLGLEGLDLSWLADGEITVGEIVAFLGAILITVSEPVRNVFKAMVSGSEDKR
jgi:hypothetical protein